jgi:protein-disulfide isomerase
MNRTSTAPATRRGASRRRRTWTVAALVATVTLVGVMIQMSRADSDAAGPTPPDLTAASGVAWGDPDAAVTVDIYADLLCPACRMFEAATGETVASLVDSGEVDVRYHVISFLDRASTNAYSTRAASAAYCAASSERFPGYLRQLYAAQPAEGGPGHDNGTLVALGSAAGVDSDGFADCVTEERYAGFAARVTEAANQAGVTSTPTVLVDGAVVEDRTSAGLVAAVEAAQRG